MNTICIYKGKGACLCSDLADELRPVVVAVVLQAFSLVAVSGSVAV